MVVVRRPYGGRPQKLKGGGAGTRFFWGVRRSSSDLLWYVSLFWLREHVILIGGQKEEGSKWRASSILSHLLVALV